MNIRKAFERGFATVTFGGAFVLVFAGTLAMCFPETAALVA
jgi:hypothetical protein